jgi:hypothetical protein
MQVYVDPKLFDLKGAIESIPSPISTVQSEISPNQGRLIIEGTADSAVA